MALLKRSGTLFAAVMAAGMLLATPSFATVYVSLAGDNTDGTSWAHAFTTVGAGIAKAETTGEDVWVAAGTYPVTTQITRTHAGSVYGGFPAVGDPDLADRDAAQFVATLDGQGIGTTLIEWDNASGALIDGITFTGAVGNYAALNFQQAVATVRNCRFCYNKTNGAGGLRAVNSSNLTVDQCWFYKNKGRDGGGVGGYASTYTITRCMFIDNYVSNTGGAVEAHEGSGAYLANCLFAGNYAGRHGGGVRFDFQTDVQVANCTFVNNNCGSENGGGLVLLRSSGAAINCIFANNNAGAIAYVNRTPRPTVKHCLFYNNPDGVYYNEVVGFVMNVDGPDGLDAVIAEAEGNLSGDPQFVNAALGNYHVAADSPAIDAGTEENAPTDDINGVSRPVGGGIDIGMDEYKDTDGDGMPDWWEQKNGLDPEVSDAGGDPDGDLLTGMVEYLYGTNPHVADTDGDGVSDGTEVAAGTNPKDVVRPAIYVSPSGDDTTGASWATALHSLHDALSLAATQEKDVWVAAGDYPLGSSLTLPSHVAVYGGFPDTGHARFGDRNPSDYPTVLNGQHVVAPLVACNGARDVRVDGLVISGGSSTTNGAGVLCTGGATGVTFANCILRDNTTSGFGGGMTVWQSYLVTVEDCQFLQNSAQEGGGFKVHQGNCRLKRCTFSDNVASYMGGGVSDYSSPMEIDACVFNGNQGGPSGGNIECHEGNYITITNSVFARNTATDFGAAVAVGFQKRVSIANCVFANNAAAARGSGIFWRQASGKVLNSIFVNESKYAIYEEDTTSDPLVDNCLFFNCPDGVYMDEGAIGISDVDGPVGLNDLVAEADANRAGDPLLVDAAADNYGLKYGSPCIDTARATGAPAADLAGNPRPMDIPGLGVDGLGIAFDIGAHEAADMDSDQLTDAEELAYGTDPSDTDTDHDSLLDGREAHYDGDFVYDPYDPVDNPDGTDLSALNPDTDGDGVDDAIEILYGYSPIDPDSTPQLPLVSAPLAVILAALGAAALRRGGKRD